MKKIKPLLWILFLLFTCKSFIISFLDTMPPVLAESCLEFSREASFDIHHQRDWEDSKTDADFCMSFKITNRDLRTASVHKNQLKNPSANSYTEFWGKLYQQLAKADNDKIHSLLDSLDQIAKTNTLDYTEFAHVVVKMVQDIPYQYILSDKCTSEHSDYPCYGNQRFGITSPVEFLYTLKGDCDSRTVLIYTILSNFGYDPVVLISREYRHSMLALDLPATGEFIKISGKKYYFWETTGTGWEPGIIPPGMDNKNYWHIALKHE
ncbi:MAG: hypothetical protein ABJF11_13770 [Reichenbachiella sp.]|uniref:hypothetical protein n=1 Tax=Reichenbachiella sp. TaxID=2184521 RepID=UPI0032656B67